MSMDAIVAIMSAEKTSTVTSRRPHDAGEDIGYV